MEPSENSTSGKTAVPVTVLVTGVDDTVGQALIKSLRRSQVPCRIIGTNRDELSAGLSGVDGAALLPHCAHSAAYQAELRRVCRAEGVRLIFPGSEKELDLLATLRRAGRRPGRRRDPLHTERLWAKAAGASVFHLGGGVGAQQDSVFRYKSGFSDRRHSFCTWRWIINAEVHEELCAERTRANEAQGLRDRAAGYFPAYRCPTASAHAETPAESIAGKEGCLDA